jgi:hypothetical protein
VSIQSIEDLKELLKAKSAILNPPPDDSSIWRCYPLDKFLNLVTSSQLFFAPATSFQDLFEGDYGDAAKRMIRDKYGDGQYLRDFNTAEFLRPHTYISCWHESDHESDAMWKLYGDSVAIKAKFSSINKLLTWSDKEIKHSGRVNYIDYTTEHVNVESSCLPYFFKRRSFSHEREVRFLIQEHRYNWGDYPSPAVGKFAPLDINSDLSEVVLSPVMAPHIASSIKDVLRLASVSIPTRQSILLNRPVW